MNYGSGKILAKLDVLNARGGWTRNATALMPNVAREGRSQGILWKAGLRED